MKGMNGNMSRQVNIIYTAQKCTTAEDYGVLLNFGLDLHFTVELICRNTCKTESETIWSLYS